MSLDKPIKAIAQPTTFKSFNVTTGAAAAIIASTVSKSCVLLADSANTAEIFIGDTTGQVFPLLAGDSLVSKIANLTTIFARSVAAQTLHVVYEA